MKPAPFQYHRAGTLAEAGEMLATLENARPLAGGQSLMPMMNMRYAMFDHLVDLNGVDELAGITLDETACALGAMTRQRAVLEHAGLGARMPIFAEALAHVGHWQTRNRGTVGGSLAHMDPAAELMGLAALLDARLSVTGGAGERTIAIADFPLGYMTPALEPDEILTAMTFDPWASGHGWDFREFAQRHGDFAVVGAGTLMRLDEAGRIERAAIALIGVGDAPLRLTEAEEMLRGEERGEALFREAAAVAGRQEMAEDALASAGYRQRLAAVLTRRSLASAAARAAQGGAGA